MLIEFTGCTSAGKSTLILDTFKTLGNRGIPVMMGYDYILKQFHFSFKNNKIKSILVDILLIPTFIRHFSKHFQFYSNSCRFINKRKDSAFRKINLIRNLLKQVAVFDFISVRNTNNLIVIMDEGTMHSINNIFVSYDSYPDIEELTLLLPYIPRPDKTIIIDAPTQLIAERALRRNDAPYKNISRESWEMLAENAKIVFDKILSNFKSRTELILIQNNTKNNSNIIAVKNIVRFILDSDNKRDYKNDITMASSQ